MATEHNLLDNQFFPSFIINGIRITIFGVSCHPDINSFVDDIPGCDDSDDFFNMLPLCCRQVGNVGYLIPFSEKECEIIVPTLILEASIGSYTRVASEVLKMFADCYDKNVNPNTWLKDPDTARVSLTKDEISWVSSELCSLQCSLYKRGIKLLLCGSRIVGVHAPNGFKLQKDGNIHPKDFTSLSDGLVTSFNIDDAIEIND